MPDKGNVVPANALDASAAAAIQEVMADKQDLASIESAEGRPATPPKRYTATAYPGDDGEIDAALGALLVQLETKLGLPLLLLIQDDLDRENPFTELDEDVRAGLFAERASLECDKPVALLVHTNGGQAKAAYEIARMLRRRCGGFVAIVPRFAKSAGTLLVLGASRIVLCEDGELGPLDVQVYDPEREDYTSALNEVQSLERLHAFSLSAIDSHVLLLRQRSLKKLSTLIPMAHKYVAEMTRPLFEKIDTVHYTWMARLLKIAEEYAVRLLQPRYKERDAKQVARALVHTYPEHDFMIDLDEAATIGLVVEAPSQEVADIVEKIVPRLKSCTAIGRVQEKASPAPIPGGAS